MEGASNSRSDLACTKAVLPADQATASSGPIATWSIQRCFGSVASVRVSPLASVATTLPSSPPLTMRSPSAAAVRIAPSWTAIRFGSPFGSTSNSASSPSTNTAVWPRKRAATTAAPAVTGWVRSATEAVSARVSDIAVCLSPRGGRGFYHAMQLSKPCRMVSSGRLRPMKTIRLSRFSPFFQGR